MQEIAPGIVHWTARHEGIGQDVSSYWLPDAGVVLNPMLPAEGIDAFRERPPTAVLLTNRHHLRHGDAWVDAFGCTVHAPAAGLHEFGDDDPDVTPFEPGDEVPGGGRIEAVGAISPDEVAIHFPAVRALAVADGVINYGGLGFVPDQLMGEDIEGIKEGLLAAFDRLAGLDFDHLLIAHGPPVAGDGARALREFVDRGR
jgi:hypothetical protein